MTNFSDAVKVADDLVAEVKKHNASGENRVTIVKAAPGSGKSTALLSIAKQLVAEPEVQIVAIAAQTNNQANDLAVKLTKSIPANQVYRFASTLTKQPDNFEGRWVTSAKEIDGLADSIVIATAAKWGQAVKNIADFRADYLLVDEAYQMPWSTFMQVSCLSSNFVMIGDPGQIPPVVPVDYSRWETSKIPPHWAAPTTLLKMWSDLPEGTNHFDELGYCFRLPNASIDYVAPFYEDDNVTVRKVAEPGDRSLEFLASASLGQSPTAEALKLMVDGAPVLLTVPMEKSGAPLDADEKLAQLIAEAVEELFKAQPVFSMTDNPDADHNHINEVLRVSDVAICSTKRAMNALIENKLQPVLAALPNDRLDDQTLSSPNKGLKVDTPERLQGLEFKVFIAVHPLSSAVQPTAFDLETGRLCVVASRHQVALLLVSRDHILETLNSELPDAEQAIGIADQSGIGHRLHKQFIDKLVSNKRVISTQ